MNDNIELGKASLDANADYFDAIHPFWWSLNADGTVSATSWTDDADVLATTKAHSIKLMPLVYGGDNVSAIRGVISSAATMATHVQTLAQLATAHNYDGIEIDYEHLWDAGDRAGYTAFVTQLATALHAEGKELSLAVPAIAVDNGQNGYDYAALVTAGADVIHLMGYDFHGTTTDHLGPLAPVGWIDTVEARVQTLGVSSHFVLGIGNYGVSTGWYANSSDSIQLCGGTYSTTTDHMESCPYGIYTAGISPHCTTSKGDLWFEDANSAAEKAKTALNHGLRGISYYSLGGEPPGWIAGLSAVYP
jgi:spore germination protein YaaH